MFTTFHLASAQDLSPDILEAIKRTFKTKAITITVQEELDPTSYLLASPANKMQLDKSIAQDHKGEYISVKFSEL
jgi:hypothetical protein